MTRSRWHMVRAGALLTLFALASKGASAAWSDVTRQMTQGMTTAWALIASIFTFDAITRTPMIREGVLKFLIFILILRVVQVSLSKKGDHGAGESKPFDRKTAGIIGFVVAAATVIFTPNTYLFAGIIALIVPLMLIGWLAWYGMHSKGDCGKEFVGLIVIFFTMFVAQYTQSMFRTWNPFSPTALQPFVYGLLNITTGIVAILFVVKLIKLLFCFGSGDMSFGGEKKEHAKEHHHEEEEEEEEHEPEHGETQESHNHAPHAAHEHPAHPEHHEPHHSPRELLPTIEQASAHLPTGHGRIVGIVIDPHNHEHPVVNDVHVWLERGGQRIEGAYQHVNGPFMFQFPQLPVDHIVVRAAKEGYMQGSHLDAANGGMPAHPINLSREHPVDRAVVPIVAEHGHGSHADSHGGHGHDGHDGHDSHTGHEHDGHEHDPLTSMVKYLRENIVFVDSLERTILTHKKFLDEKGVGYIWEREELKKFVGEATAAVIGQGQYLSNLRNLQAALKAQQAPEKILLRLHQAVRHAEVAQIRSGILFEKLTHISNVLAMKREKAAAELGKEYTHETVKDFLDALRENLVKMRTLLVGDGHNGVLADIDAWRHGPANSSH